MSDSSIDGNLPPHSHETPVSEEEYVERDSAPEDFTEALDEEE